MNKEFRLMQNNLQLWYYRYKDSFYFSLGVIFLVILSCIIIFFQVIMPQVQSWFSIRDEVIRTKAQVANIDKNISFMSSVDQALLNNQVEIATGTLPIEKNFGGIVAALSDSAAKSGIILEDFSFEVGSIASSEGQLNLFKQKGLSTVTITFSLKGSAQTIADFLKEIQQRIPLSEVTEISSDSFSTLVSVQFFQKKFPEITYKDDVPISPLSASQLSLLQELSSWKPVVSQEQQTSTGSAESVPLF